MPLSKVREICDVDPAPLDVPSNGHGPGRRLQELDLNFPGEETQHSTHCLHPYVAAINPPLARELIRTFLPTGGRLLDPFCGGGGVLVESVLAGSTCAGTDINPLAVEVSSAKTTHLPRDVTFRKLQEVQDLALELVGTARPETDPAISYWFLESTIPPITALAQSIGTVERQEVRTLFRTVLSATVRDVMLTYRGEVRLRHLGLEDMKRFRPDVFPAFQRRALTAIERVDSLPRQSNCQVTLGDARKRIFDDEEFSTVISSPPYADDKNGVGYFQFSRNMLYFLGYDLHAIRRYRELFLGGVKRDRRLPDSKYLAKAIARISDFSPILASEAVAFYSDYFLALRELIRVVRDRVIIVIGNRVLGRTILDNAKITRELYDLLDVKPEYYFRRTFTKKRIPNLGGDGGGTNVEHILVFRK